MERSRARAMADMMATHQLSLSGAGDQQLYAESVRLRSVIATKQAELFQLINGGAKPGALAPVDREIASLENIHRKLLARMSVEAPQLQELITSRAVAARPAGTRQTDPVWANATSSPTLQAPQSRRVCARLALVGKDPAGGRRSRDSGRGERGREHREAVFRTQQKPCLVVFSACETGKAEATSSNEVLGMIRALLYAGAGSVVLSYWEVDAASTAQWMETFHRAVQANPPAGAAREALRAVKNRPEFAHPYFWSAFTLLTK
jgi:hypothetical protein